ncbi:MAG: Flp pilus assembly complex ATPase component TadA [Candidatus Altiarchaeota archaeon]|nr:Flp pilus assembly complex ATPase component TadA [Candidatus Altiarchaeota archaeon]
MPEAIITYGDVTIYKAEQGILPKYVIKSVQLTDDEKAVLEHPQHYVGDITKILDEISEIPLVDERENKFKAYVEGKLSNLKLKNKEYILSWICDRLFWRYGIIGPLMRDDELEEIMVNGIANKIIVFHRKVGMCETELAYDSYISLKELVEWLSMYSNRKLTVDNPLLDCHMPDGSRANVAIPPAAPTGPAVTIRKFKANPYTILDLIEVGTVSYELAAFLWLCVEGFRIKPLDIVLAGGAGAGKTTLLNALAMMIPKNERIITVEDTMELNFDFIKNWVPLEASPTETDQSRPLSMHSLLKNSLRMRPDRVIVGEVRGAEAETLFIAMDIGLDGSIATIHANNARETVMRFSAEPMNIPTRMITLLDVIVVLNRIVDRKKGVMRRVTQVAEVAGVEGDVIQLGDIFYYDITTDTVSRTDYPIILFEKIAKECGINKKRIQTEVMIREKILQYMMKQNLRKPKQVISFIQQYYNNPKDVLEKLRLG